MMVAVALAAFVSMEAVSYLMHRFVMHGPGVAVHSDHHTPPVGRFQRNDLYPATFSIVAIVFFALGTSVPGLRWMLAIGIGMTLYGAAYFYVHDVYVHRRLSLPRPRWGVLVWLAERHRLHHRYGGEPYGMLLPLVPRALRERAARTRDSRNRL